MNRFLYANELKKQTKTAKFRKENHARLLFLDESFIKDPFFKDFNNLSTNTY